jgi:hypothetical protein
MNINTSRCAVASLSVLFAGGAMAGESAHGAGCPGGQNGHNREAMTDEAKLTSSATRRYALCCQCFK